MDGYVIYEIIVVLAFAFAGFLLIVVSCDWGDD